MKTDCAQPLGKAGASEINRLSIQALIISRTKQTITAVVAAGLFTLIGLLSKESAIAIPAMLAVAWVFDGRKQTWMIATVFSGMVVAVYLGIRAQPLLHQPENTQYLLSIWNLPLRWVEYQLYWIIHTLGEPHQTIVHGLDASVVWAGLLWIGLLAALWWSHWRFAILFLVGGIVSLVPVLPIAASFNQYAYVFSALTAMVVAAAWTTAPRWGRAIISLVAVLSLMHGMVVMKNVRHVGEIQAVFSPALADVVAGTELSNKVRLRPAPEAAEWIFRRLTHDIPSYRGISIGERVRLVTQDSTADYTIEADGHLSPMKNVSSGLPSL